MTIRLFILVCSIFLKFYRKMSQLYPKSLSYHLNSFHLWFVGWKKKFNSVHCIRNHLSIILVSDESIDSVQIRIWTFVKKRKRPLLIFDIELIKLYTNNWMISIKIECRRYTPENEQHSLVSYCFVRVFSCWFFYFVRSF